MRKCFLHLKSPVSYCGNFAGNHPPPRVPLMEYILKARWSQKRTVLAIDFYLGSKMKVKNYKKNSNEKWEHLNAFDQYIRYNVL